MNNFKNKLYRQEQDISITNEIETKKEIVEEVKSEQFNVKKEKVKRKKKELIQNLEDNESKEDSIKS